MRRFYVNILYGLFLFSLVFLTAVPAVSQLKPIRRSGELAPAPATRPVHPISRQNLLRLDRPTPYSLPLKSVGAASATTQTLRILAIRVDFPPDTTSLTTGNGTFDYRTPAQFEQQEGHIIDQAPHDRLYFERHLKAMSDYYDVASFGQLQLSWRVFPDSLRTAYTLPHPMEYYSPDVDFFDPLKVERLVDFVIDAFSVADQDAAIVFDDYDAFILFHAGSDLQHDRLQNSPSDLQSGFLRIGDERAPIIVDGNKAIREMILMPETTSQDGNIGALNTTLTHEFGHQIGLPDLYSTFSFAPGVGALDLMDLESGTVDIGENNRQIVTGALPTGLSAWSRAFLGWIDPVEVTADSTDIFLFASWHLTPGVKAIRIPVAPGEYFLIENRQTDLDGDGISFLNFQDGIIVGPSNANKQPNREYDYLLPGSGVVIWHVDENVAFGDFNQNGEINWVENALQWDELHRFLDVEEADGIQNLGFTTDPLRREDLFYKGNNTLFSSITRPDSRMYSGANSHVAVRIHDAPDIRMRITVTRSHRRSGWPVAAGGRAETHAPILADVNGDRKLEAFMVSPDGRLYAWNSDGTGFIPGSETVRQVRFTGDTLTIPAAVFSEPENGFLTDPAIADLEGDGVVDIVATDAEKVYAWLPVDQNGDGRADIKPGFPVRLIQPSTGGPGNSERVFLTSPVLIKNGAANFDILTGTSTGGLIILRPDGGTRLSVNVSRHLSERLINPPAVADLDGDGVDEIIALLTASGSGRIEVIDRQGQPLWTQTVGPVGRASNPLISDIDGSGAFDVIIAGSDGTLYAWTGSGAPLTGWPTRMAGEATAPPAAGDLDGDGRPEVIVSGNNRIHAVHGNGTTVTNFPVIINRVNPVGHILSSPAIGDLDGDENPEIVVGLPDGTIRAFHGSGHSVDGFPLGASGAVFSSPALGDMDDDGSLALVVGSDDGFVHLWRFPDASGTLPWSMLGHDARRAGASPAPSQKPPPGSGDLLAAGSVFCYPNPVNSGSTGIRYHLNRAADQVRIRVYTLSGDLVDALEGAGFQNQNEIRWDVTRVVSGVYLCQVEASDTEGRQSVFFKIAVVK